MNILDHFTSNMGRWRVGGCLSEQQMAVIYLLIIVSKCLMSPLGIDILEPKRVETTVKAPDKEIIYEFSVHHAKAEMKIIEDKYIVLKGSTAVIKNRPSVLAAIKKMRESLVSSGVLKENSKLNEQNEKHKYT